MDLSSLYSRFNPSEQSEGKLPPVHLWNPPFCGDIDIQIDREGLWFHEGTRITRQPLVNLFSSVLKREADEYFLVTPAEKCRIQVKVAPLRVIHGSVLNAKTPEQALELSTEQGLRLVRNVYYQLAEYLEPLEDLNTKVHNPEGSPLTEDTLGIRSNGTFFVLET